MMLTSKRDFDLVGWLVGPMRSVAELEVDLQHSDADLEKAINQLESHGIAFE